MVRESFSDCESKGERQALSQPLVRASGCNYSNNRREAQKLRTLLAESSDQHGSDAQCHNKIAKLLQWLRKTGWVHIHMHHLRDIQNQHSATSAEEHHSISKDETVPDIVLSRRPT